MIPLFDNYFSFESVVQITNKRGPTKIQHKPVKIKLNVMGSI